MAREQVAINRTFEKVAALQANVERVIRGKSEVVQLCIAALLAKGHILLEDVPGVGKTTLAHALARSLSLSFQRIQFTSDLLPADIVGITIYKQEQQEFEFVSGPIFTHVLLADEINRATPKTQSALLEAMSEGMITIEKNRLPLPDPFLVIATQNPVEHHGTYPLPESQLDRFLMRLYMGYPDGNSERDILRAKAGTAQLQNLEAVLTGEDILEMQQVVTQVEVDDSLVNYALEIVARTRKHEKLTLGVSPRGSQMLYRAAQAMAFLDGRSFCVPEDFKPLAVPVFAHRVAINGTSSSSSLRKFEQADRMISEIVDSIPVPI